VKCTTYDVNNVLFNWAKEGRKVEKVEKKGVKTYQQGLQTSIEAYQLQPHW
jgi:hypothetical protein